MLSSYAGSSYFHLPNSVLHIVGCAQVTDSLYCRPKHN